MVKLTSFAKSGGSRLDFVPSEEELALAQMVRRSLLAAVHTERYPKSEISVSALVLEADGSLPALLISAAGAALVAARVEMSGLVVAASAAVRHGAVYVDPDAVEEESTLLGTAGDAREGLDNCGLVHLACLMPDTQVTLLEATGHGLSDQATHAALDALLDVCSDNYAFVLETFKQATAATAT